MFALAAWLSGPGNTTLEHELLHCSPPVDGKYTLQSVAGITSSHLVHAAWQRRSICNSFAMAGTLPGGLSGQPLRLLGDHRGELLARAPGGGKRLAARQPNLPAREGLLQLVL